MVSVSFSKHTADVGLSNAPVPKIDKCRYKTGKCSHVRSSKRNGQLHQLCLYHREKANMIQRRFDRQKRRAARAKVVRDHHDPTSRTSVSILNPVVSPTGSPCSTSSSMSNSSFDSDGINSHSPDSEKCWSNTSNLGPTSLSKFSDMPLPMSCHQSYMSTDEIAFLCSAIL